MTKIKVAYLRTEYTRSYGGRNLFHASETIANTFAIDAASIEEVKIDMEHVGSIGPCDFIPVSVRQADSRFWLLVADQYNCPVGDYYTRMGGSPMSREAAMADAEGRMLALLAQVNQAKEVAHA